MYAEAFQKYGIELMSLAPSGGRGADPTLIYPRDALGIHARLALLDVGLGA